jgi:glycosyltransferase involved in cell wall biosynthesis
MYEQVHEDRPLRVLRSIARLNVGGPAIQVVNLTRRLVPLGYQTVLLRGQEAAQEGTMDHLADALEVRPVRVPGFQRGIGAHDLRALRSMIGYLRHFRPDVLHTHTAKAGALGRLAVILSPWWRPRVVVHTFHGHVLKGEFSPRVSRAVALVEKILALPATRLIAVSKEIKDDLVEFGVARPEKIEVVNLGFDLTRFTTRDGEREAVRRRVRDRLGIPHDARVVTVIARVVKVKRIDRFIEMARELADLGDVWFLVAGDGDRRKELEASPAAQELGERLVWAGFEREISDVCFASDVVVLTSDNEGTPVCLIEAQAAAVPVVTTLVGGVETVVRDGVTGRVVSRDHTELARATRELLERPEERMQMGRAGREHVSAHFTVDRLVSDIDALYRRLLAAGNGRP